MTLADAAALAALVLSVSAIIFTGLQWKAAERSADAAEVSANIADETMKATRQIAQTGQRPWVTLTLTAIAVNRHAEDPVLTIEGRFTFRNGGTTPAIDLTIQSSHKFLEAFPEDPPYVALEEEELSKGVLGPGEDCGVPFAIQTSKADLDEFQRKNMNLFAYGRVRYTDIFKDAHTTKYCLQYYPNRQTFSYYCRYNELT